MIMIYIYIYYYLSSTPNKALNYLFFCHSLYLSPYSYETKNLTLHTCAVGHLHTRESLPYLHYTASTSCPLTISQVLSSATAEG